MPSRATSETPRNTKSPKIENPEKSKNGMLDMQENKEEVS
jgi:hypothetical protein